LSSKRFNGNFTQQEPIPEVAIERAVDVMRSGRLHRYNITENEQSETALLEEEFATLLGSQYCLACTSGGYALHITLRAWGLRQGEAVLTNAFTLSPVPGAIHNAGGVPVLVECTRDLVIDLDDLEKKIKNAGARVLLLSHMRGHIVDMQALSKLLIANDVALIEDCAHTMGATWKNQASGSFGVAACFSTQTYKHINSGEGGLVVSNDAELMARATMMTGSYMLFDRHTCGPDTSVYDEIKYTTPNMSGRMDNLRASLLRPQLQQLNANCARWNSLYDALAQIIRQSNKIYLPLRPEEENFVGSSLQFLIDSFDLATAQRFIGLCQTRGVELKWFGADEPAGYTSNYQSWRYFDSDQMPQTDLIMSKLFDLRLPLTFTTQDATLIGEIILEVVEEL